MIMMGLDGIGVGTVVAPIQTATSLNGLGVVMELIMFMVGAKKDSIQFKGWVAWVWDVLLCNV